MARRPFTNSALLLNGPIGSSMAPFMMGMSEADDWCDNVLLEWSLALELSERTGRRIRILPIFIGSQETGE